MKPKIQKIYRVVANRPVCARYFQLSLDAPELARQVAPGQFIHIRVADGLEPFFRRPFSVFRARRSVDILYEPVGRGTTLLSRIGRGQELDVLGPLGRGFTPPGERIRQVVMVAGGIGVAPFMILSDQLRKRKDLDVVLLYGARGEGHVFDLTAFRQNGCRVLVATEDGKVGIKGYVSRLFPEIRKDPETTMIYTCGPKPMMRAAQEFAARHKLTGEASCEEVMACGLGACLGCSTPTADGYKTVCHDGPVFDLQKVVIK